MDGFYIKPNTEVIEKLIHNYKSGSLTTIYGNSGSGKTTCCLLASISAAIKNKVIFLDSNHEFNINRLSQLTNNKRILENIFLIKLNSFEEQHKIICSRLRKLCENEKIKLIIVDSIGKYYRLELSQNPEKANISMLMQLKELIRIARDLNKVVLITNLVYSSFSNELKMIGGNFILNMSKIVIELRKQDSNRIAKLIKYKTERKNTTHYNLGKKIKFEIKEKGIFLEK